MITNVSTYAAQARSAARRLGHKLSRLKLQPDRHTRQAFCETCGAKVNVIFWLRPGEAPISGEALRRNCDAR